MTFVAAKLVQVQIFVSIRNVIAKKNGVKGNVHGRPPARPTARNHDSNTLWAFSQRGKKGRDH